MKLPGPEARARQIQKLLAAKKLAAKKRQAKLMAKRYIRMKNNKAGLPL